jgi:uncharacterized protein
MPAESPQLTISKQTARRLILGRQGLFPGRRESGKAGTDAALRRSESVQIDTINVLARSHDLTLFSRVEDYEPGFLDELMYSERKFFDYGGILMVYPCEELPYWRTVMARQWERYAAHERSLPETCAYVLDELRGRGALTNRDFVARERIPGGYRTIKDTGHALYYLWRGGQVMTHSRRRFERVYDLTENIMPSQEIAPEAEAEQFFARKALRDTGLATAAEWARRVSIYLHHRPNPAQSKAILNSLVETGEAIRIGVDGRKEIHYTPADSLPHIETLEAGKIPLEWHPVGATTSDEVTFIAPLDNVIWDRARTQAIFDFEYLWEVYKPEHLRRWGYYTLPILYGDRFAARMAMRMERKTKTLRVEGFWLENENFAYHEAFLSALQIGLARLARFAGAETVSEFSLHAAARG